MKSHRLPRVNALLQEIITEVIRDDLRHPGLPPFISVTHVDVSKDLRHAHVLFNVIGDETVKQRALQVLEQSAKFIAVQSSKKVVLRYFPELSFELDRATEHYEKIENVLRDIHDKERSRNHDGTRN